MTRHAGNPPRRLIDTRLAERLRRRLLSWFAKHQRDLPWRRRRDPYAIWVSEIMLQQTQVATVIPYFERFLAAFPRVTDLAKASEADVLRLWEGLGYYRRARDLHRAARIVCAEHAGQLPTDAETLRCLPGIGRYTAGAILSQAHDTRLPILEANSRRLLARLFARRGDPTRGPVQRWLWQAAEELLPERQVGDFNQALMELGALVCTATAPKCSACPLTRDCAAHRLGVQEKIPPPLVKPRTVHVRELALVIQRGAGVLLVQRPAAGRWANLWEFPHAPMLDDETEEAAARRLILPLTGMTARLERELLTIRHSVTHHRITLCCLQARYRSGRFKSDVYPRAAWVERRQLPEYPVSSPQRRLARLVMES